MNDEDHEITYDDEDLIEELHQNISISSETEIQHLSNQQTPKKRAHKPSGELRHPRPRFCPRWQIEFPWLRPNRSDESIGYCNICKRELVCKKSHLERHQRSFKHMRLQGFENVFTVNEPEADLIEAHTSGYLDNDTSQDYQVEEVMEEIDDEYTSVKVEPTRPSFESSPVFGKTKSNKKPPPKKGVIKAEPGQSSSMHQTSFESPAFNSHSYYDRSEEFYHPAPKKDSFDLFFDSISATVKSLPPKLAAEVKSKVSQVIAEFELRAICEKEAEENAKQSVLRMPTQLTSVVTVDQTLNSGPSEQHTVDGVTTYVYTYPQK